MAIKIIEDKDLHLTRSEFERLRQEYDRVCSFMVDPPSFETWAHQRVEDKEGPTNG